jgi:hypothetical protein
MCVFEVCLVAENVKENLESGNTGARSWW